MRAKSAIRAWFARFRYLGSHENIVSLEDLFISENHDELYIVMELLDCDLHYVINKSNQALGNAHHRYFMYQILRGVQVRQRRCKRNSTVETLNQFGPHISAYPLLLRMRQKKTLFLRPSPPI